MFKYLRLLPKYKNNANKGTKRIYLFLSGFLFLFVLSALSGLQILDLLIGPDLAGIVSQVTIPSFGIMSMAAFFQRSTLRRSPYKDAYKAMTTMIKHQFAGLFVVVVIFAFYFESITQLQSQSVTSNQEADTPVLYIVGTVSGLLVYLYGFFGVLRACWKYSKNVTSEEKLT